MFAAPFIKPALIWQLVMNKGVKLPGLTLSASSARKAAQLIDSCNKTTCGTVSLKVNVVIMVVLHHVTF